MSYVTTGSSNSVTNGSPLNLDIQISQDPLKNILLMGRFIIDDLNTIASGGDLKKMTCELWGKTDDANRNSTIPVKICDLLYDSNTPGKRTFIFPRDFDDEYTYLILKIGGADCTITQPTTTLNIAFFDKNGPSQPPKETSIPFEVKNEPSKPEILSFRADPEVLQGNRNPVLFSWKVKGDTYSYTLREGLTELKTGKGTNTESDSFRLNAVAIGNHSYTLEVKQGGATVVHTVQVRALGKSGSYPDGNPLLPNRLGNFCADEDGTYLFSLMLKQDRESASIDHIGYTNEGFSGKWSKIKLSEDDIKKLKDFAVSPMVHLRDVGEVYGRLFFVGGSHVKPMDTKNAVAIVELDSDSESKVRIVENLPWESRMGHSILVFPHGGVDKIWLMGGVDEWGAANNDIWVSADGTRWDNLNPDGSVNNDASQPAKMPWDARCMASVTPILDSNKKKTALWFGGGFSEIGGSETPDLWKFEANAWSKISGLNINEGSYLSSGICFVGKDDLKSTGVYLQGGFVGQGGRNKYFKKINLIDGEYSAGDLDTSSGVGIFDTSKEAQVVTTFYKGCMWYMVYTNEGDSGITYSDMYYWIPVVTGQTLIIN